MSNVFLSKLSAILFVLLAVFLFFRYAGTILILLLPFVFGYILSRILSKFVDQLEKRTFLNRSFATLLVLLVSIAGILFGLFMIGRISYIAINSIEYNPEALMADFNEYYNIFANYFTELFGSFDFDLQAIITENISKIIDSLSTIASSLATGVLSFVAFLPQIFLGTVFMLISTYFMTKDSPMIKGYTQAFYNKYLANRMFIEIKDRVFGVLIGYFKAQLILMSITFFISAIGLTILGVEHSILKALGVALVDFIPMLGPALVYVPWLISKLIVKKFSLALGLGVLYLVVTLTRQALEPKIVSTQIGIHPLLTLSFMYLGIKTIGFLGIILGPITIIIINTVISSYRQVHEIHDSIDDQNLEDDLA